MDKNQFILLIIAILFLGLCALFSNGIYEYRSIHDEDYSYIKFNKFTGKAVIAGIGYEHKTTKTISSEGWRIESH